MRLKIRVGARLLRAEGIIKPLKFYSLSSGESLKVFEEKSKKF